MRRRARGLWDLAVTASLFVALCGTLLVATLLAWEDEWKHDTVSL